jgi:hypothetical protein
MFLLIGRTEGRSVVTDHSELHREHGFRHHTGAVGLIFHGERPQPKSSAQILEIAKATEFFEEGTFKAEYAGGTIEYVPRTFVPDAIGEALVRGLLLYKFRINDDPPRMFRDLDPGEYYVYMDFIEGPDFQDGRWVGRVVNGLGGLECWVTGVEVKQLGDFHLDIHEDHSKPQIEIHGLAAEGSSAQQIVEEAPAVGIAWNHTQVSWIPVGVGCYKTIVCMPQG